MKDGRSVEHPRPANALSRDAEELVRAAQAHAERLCELALAQTPVQYHSFIVLIEQRKKVGGSEANPIWAEIRLPYLTVDGRVRMAIDEHEEAGKQLHIETAFVMDQTTGPGQRIFVFPTLRLVAAMTASLPGTEGQTVNSLVVAALIEAAKEGTAVDGSNALAALEAKQKRGIAQEEQDTPGRF